MAVPTIPSHRVLPTLNNDGSRRWVRPKAFRGKYYWRRLLVGWGLIVMFVTLPFIRIGGAPAILLDIPGRKFHLFGATFFATDGVLLMLLMLTIFVSIFWLTALLGRVWCGWGCPQTVYLEFLFRPIEQWLEGPRGQQLKLDREGPNGRRVLKYAIYGVLSVLVANVFLAYFVGVNTLGHWMQQSPLQHPTGFLVVGAVSALVFFDFAYFREQMCTIACPYARLQSVLLDKHSLTIGYDERRGEPRAHGRNVGGDCIDCTACVVACPTGIDIRDGLQLECVACAQCVDACDSVMTKLNKPTGLIRYANQAWFTAGERPKFARPRVVVYTALTVGLLAATIAVGRVQQRSEVTVLRGIGAPFVEQGELIRNQLRVKVRNRHRKDATYHLAVSGTDESRLIAPENPFTLAPGEQSTVSAFVLTPRNSFDRGVRHIEVVLSEPGGTTRVPYKLLGPTP